MKSRRPVSFLDLEPQFSDYQASRFAILPVPYEGSVTYGPGTAGGPACQHRYTHKDGRQIGRPL